jgi:hypothetical protein
VSGVVVIAGGPLSSMGHVEPLEFTGYGDEDGHTFPSPSSTLALVGAPTFPNSIKWSEDNLIAVASGHLVTILVR